ncbi:response regulator [Massilia sp. CF038]|uniref:response regulator n=1 Tax=Massilia sp. CF038 TaxID=1881045 RepID=UPI0009241801|nr:response regulator [Massilia sp. CF038]SHH00904.1 Response regulator receiver domain-containing protein [Massilia sp. CF038]
MPEPSASTRLAAHINWQASDLGEPAGWTHALRLSIDILLNSPWPQLLVWGERQVIVYNQAYVDLAGPGHPPAPGARAPALYPPLLSASLDAYQRARAGTPQHLMNQRLALLPGTNATAIDADLHLTPLRDEHGQVAGVLYAVARSAAPAHAVPDATGLRVLVVEDNLDSQYLVCEMLKAFGHDADGVAHAEGALDKLAGGRYDVLFSDVSLPGISGVDLARQALQKTPGMHVIFASGYGEALLRHVDFPFQSLQKPYEIEQLQAALAAVAGGARIGSGAPNV